MASPDLAGLYAEHAPGARRLAACLVPRDDAEDLVAESFARITAAVRRGGRPERFRPYLMTVMRHEARRSAGKHRLRAVPEPAPEPPPAPGADEEAARAEEAMRVLAAFAALPERWRAVLWATAVEGHGPAELAGRWGMSPAAVAQLAARAREGLRRAWLQAHVGPVPGPCRRYAADLGAATRGRLARSRRAALDAHLAGCPGCRAQAAELAGLNARMRELLGPAALLLAARRFLTRLHPAALGAGVAAAAGLTLVTLPYATPPGAPAAPAVSRPALAVPAPPLAGPRMSGGRHARAAPAMLPAACTSPAASPSAVPAAAPARPAPSPGMTGTTAPPGPSPSLSPSAPASQGAPPGFDSSQVSW